MPGMKDLTMEKISRLNPLFEILKKDPCRIRKVLLQQGARNPRVSELVALAEKARVSIQTVPRKRLDTIDRHHQGAVAFVSPRAYVSVRSILASSQRPFLVLLDGIADPQNLGAILRSAEGAGVDGIILPQRRAAGLTSTVAAVSAGALEHVRVARVPNLAQTMEELKKKNIWIVGAETGAPDLWYEFDYTLPVALVFGSEAKGLRPLVRKRCDRILSLPLLGEINSLNVAAAAAIFLYEVVRQRGAAKNE